MTVRQLYPQDMQNLSSTFIYACDHGFRPVTLDPLAEVQASISALEIMPVSVRCHARCVRPTHPTLS
ncbi:uncharacterized protein BDZ99DRAFT_466627 [Mytilinidion resinicola]|uniref:Uncharacterized protein n=1 Tax=Mytilinidion resinicola TaxID=574789 RepID=A0A6A6YC57_9PEZI|nr:uncharacterized protein BDZ99DRAFT_466627 [Mytilinidion resinicola]KAF2805685.1 hypothetical protein BDZ99DRAFT_466627 [Mytilinidion resinicola]